MQLTKDQQIKADNTSYLLMRLVNTVNFDDFITCLETKNNYHKFLMTIRFLIYEDYNWNIEDIILLGPNKVFYLRISSLNTLINFVSQQKIKSNNPCKFIHSFINKQILSQVYHRDTLSSLLIIYFEDEINDEICAMYYDALQSWINWNAV